MLPLQLSGITVQLLGPSGYQADVVGESVSMNVVLGFQNAG